MFGANLQTVVVNLSRELGFPYVSVLENGFPGLCKALIDADREDLILTRAPPPKLGGLFAGMSSSFGLQKFGGVSSTLGVGGGAGSLFGGDFGKKMTEFSESLKLAGAGGVVVEPQREPIKPETDPRASAAGEGAQQSSSSPTTGTSGENPSSRENENRENRFSNFFLKAADRIDTALTHAADKLVEVDEHVTKHSLDFTRRAGDWVDRKSAAANAKYEGARNEHGGVLGSARSGSSSSSSSSRQSNEGAVERTGTTEAGRSETQYGDLLEFGEGGGGDQGANPNVESEEGGGTHPSTSVLPSAGGKPPPEGSTLVDGGKHDALKRFSQWASTKMEKVNETFETVKLEAAAAAAKAANAAASDDSSADGRDGGARRDNEDYRANNMFSLGTFDALRATVTAGSGGESGAGTIGATAGVDGGAGTSTVADEGTSSQEPSSQSATPREEGTSSPAVVTKAAPGTSMLTRLSVALGTASKGTAAAQDHVGGATAQQAASKATLNVPLSSKKKGAVVKKPPAAKKQRQDDDDTFAIETSSEDEGTNKTSADQQAGPAAAGPGGSGSSGAGGSAAPSSQHQSQPSDDSTGGTKIPTPRYQIDVEQIASYKKGDIMSAEDFML